MMLINEWMLIDIKIFDTAPVPPSSIDNVYKTNNPPFRNSPYKYTFSFPIQSSNLHDPAATLHLSSKSNNHLKSMEKKLAIKIRKKRKKHSKSKRQMLS